VLGKQSKRLRERAPRRDSGKDGSVSARETETARARDWEQLGVS